MKGFRLFAPEAAAEPNTLAQFARLLVVVAAALRLQPPSVHEDRSPMRRRTQP
jgi:hypothetical protein